MKNDIIRKLTSLTLMTIMVAGGLTFAIPGALPHAVAESATSGQLTVSTTEFGGQQILEIIVDDPKIADVSIIHAELFIDVGDDSVQMFQASTGDWYAYVGIDADFDPASPSGLVTSSGANHHNADAGNAFTTTAIDIEDGDDIDVTYGDNTITVSYANDLSEFASVAFDRSDAPAEAVVHLTIADTRLNLDPTVEDTWTLTVNTDTITRGLSDGHGLLELTLANFDIEDSDDNTDGMQIVFAETGANTGEFTAEDVGEGDAAESPLTLKESVQENEPVDISYAGNDARLTVRTTESSITITAADVWSSGEEATVTLTYPDLNLNTDADEDIKIEHEFVPTIIIGNPTTIEDFKGNNTIAPGDTDPENKIFTFSNSTTEDNAREIPDEMATFTITGFSSDAPFHFVKSVSTAAGAEFTLRNTTDDDPNTNEVDTSGMIEALPSNMTLTVTTTATSFMEGDIIAFDILSFGGTDDGVANNAIYRQLLEETEDGGVFTGTLKYTMLHQANVDDPGTYEDVETLGADLDMVIDDEYTGNEFHISYNKKSHPADILTNTGTVTLDSDRYSTNGEVTVTLEDPDLNTDSTSVDSYVLNKNGTVRDGTGTAILQVEIDGEKWEDCTDKDGKDRKLGLPDAFELAETEAASGTFTASFDVPTEYCTNVVNDEGTIIVADATGKSIKVVYHDFRDDGGNDAEASDSATIQAVTGTVSLDRNVYPVPADVDDGAGNVIVHIEINDPDLNKASDERDTLELANTVELRLRAVNTGGSDPINDALNDKSIDLRYSLVNENNLDDFMETTVDSGIFAETVEIPANLLVDDQMDQVERSYVLTVSYTDISDATGEESTVSDSAIFNVGGATLSADSEEYTINQSAFITLTDHDRNYDSAERDTITLADIKWEGSTDTNLLDGGFDPTPSTTLRETEANSGIFLAEITIPETIEGGDEVERGERVTLTYEDISPAGSNYPGEGKPVDVETSFAISITGASMTLDKDVYSWRDHVTVTVVAPDGNIDGLVVEDINIRANSQGGSLDDQRLPETGANTGIFRGTIELGGPDNAYIGISCSDNQLCVENEDGFSVVYTYDEDERDIIQSALIRWSVAEVTWLEDSYREGSVGTLRVIDPDMNFYPDAPDSISATVFSDTFRGGANIALTETEPDSGVFEGEVLFDVLHTEGNRLQVSEGDIVTATYKDQTLPPPDDRGDTIRITGTTTIGSIVPPLERVEVSNLGVVDALGTAVDSVSVGQQVNIAADITSAQSRSQDYAYLLQIQNMDGVTVHLSWAASSLAGFGGANVSQSWTPDETGSYTATVFVWESLTNPTALSPQNSIDITVV